MVGGGRGKRGGDRERGCSVSGFFWGEREEGRGQRERLLCECLGGRGKRGGDRDRGCSVSGFWGGEGRGAVTEREVAR